MLRRAFVNALGQLYFAESEAEEAGDAEDEEAVINMGDTLFSEFKAYIAGVSNQERRDWEQVCDQIWRKDSRKGTQDVDQIGSGRMRRDLRRQIKVIFSS
jgi:hypothetical protein